MEETVSIEGVDPAKLLAELVNNTSAQGLGVTAALSFGPFGEEQAQKFLDSIPGDVKDFDYVAGRPIKLRLDLKANEASRVWLYDRDAGAGAFARVLAKLR